MSISMKYNELPKNIPTEINPNWRIIGYDTKKIWTEYQLINRLLYRSRNQHKASLSFQHLKEIKRIGERIGKLEMWLKANYVEKGEGLFDFLGYLNTLRLLIEKDIAACRKTFYFYCHYLDQGLFVTLALIACASVSSLHSELLQWRKYVKIIYESGMEKLSGQNGMEKVGKFCEENQLEMKIRETEIVDLKFDKPDKSDKSDDKHSNSSNIKTTNNTNTTKSSSSHKIPSKNKSISKGSFANPAKKPKPSKGGDEIDDIFNSL